MIRGLLSVLFVFVVYNLNAQTASRTTLFSVTGDTVLTYTGYQFGGPTIDSLIFSVGARNNEGIKWLEHFRVPNKLQVTTADYPKQVILKYRLLKEGVDIKPDSCEDADIVQMNLENKKVEVVKAATDQDSAYNLYKCVKNISIKICGRLLVRNLRVEYDYIATHQHENRIPGNFMVPVLVKMKDRDKYYAGIVMWDMKVKYIPSHNPDELDDTQKSCTNLFQREFILSYKK